VPVISAINNPIPIHAFVLDIGALFKDMDANCADIAQSIAAEIADIYIIIYDILL
jgi:hypothetical protein